MAAPARERRPLADSLEEIRALEAWCRATVDAAAPDDDVDLLADDAERYRRVARHLERIMAAGGPAPTPRRAAPAPPPPASGRAAAARSR